MSYVPKSVFAVFLWGHGDLGSKSKMEFLDNDLFCELNGTYLKSFLNILIA